MVSVFFQNLAKSNVILNFVLGEDFRSTYRSAFGNILQLFFSSFRIQDILNVISELRLKPIPDIVKSGILHFIYTLKVVVARLKFPISLFYTKISTITNYNCE